MNEIKDFRHASFTSVPFCYSVNVNVPSARCAREQSSHKHKEREKCMRISLYTVTDPLSPPGCPVPEAPPWFLHQSSPNSSSSCFWGHRALAPSLHLLKLQLPQPPPEDKGHGVTKLPFLPLHAAGITATQAPRPEPSLPTEALTCPEDL